MWQGYLGTGSQAILGCTSVGSYSVTSANKMRAVKHFQWFWALRQPHEYLITYATWKTTHSKNWESLPELPVAFSRTFSRVVGISDSDHCEPAEIANKFLSHQAVAVIRGLQGPSFSTGQMILGREFGNVVWKSSWGERFGLVLWMHCQIKNRLHLVG